MKKYILIVLSILAVSCSEMKNQTQSSVLNVMTYNIRYDNPEDSLNNWKYRKERVANSILFYDPDILGTQEVLHNQLEDLLKLLPSYEFVGVGREDGVNKGEYSALFYKKDRFTVLDTGCFWLSETPDVAGSKGWDGACERIASWAKLRDSKSGKELIALNTHLDHVGELARREGVNLLLNKLKELSNGLPVILTGDFNATPNSDVINQIVDKSNENYLLNAKDISPVVYGPDWSFHDFGRIPFNERPLIDYIFVDKRVNVQKYGVLAETENEEFLSDHAPVFVTIEIN